MCMCCIKGNPALTSGAGILVITAAIVAVNNGDHKNDQKNTKADEQPAAALVIQDSPASITQEAKNLLQDAKHGAMQDAKEAVQDEMDDDDMMAAWIKANKLGVHHEMLNDLIGTFRADITMTSFPGAPEETATGTMVNAWVLGGRYVEGRFSGDFNGTPFTGLSYTAYSNADKQYQGIWMDSMGTAIEFSSGPGNLEDKSFSMNTTSTNPMTGDKMNVKESFTIQSHDQHTYTRSEVADDGTVISNMTIVYTRTD